MPKSLALGNGNILVCIDAKARLRDLYFPYVGLENHVGGAYMHRVGVWEDNHLGWIDQDPWRVEVDANDSYQGKSIARSPRSSLQIEMTDAVLHVRNIYLRKFVIKNISHEEKTCKIFVNQQFEIYHSEKGDTAFYDPSTQTIIHYEGKRAFLVGTLSAGKSFDEYSVGVFQMEGKEGTYKDAEDGKLEKNPIEHGRVDSTVGVSVRIQPESEETLYYWVAVGGFIEEAKELHTFILSQTPEKLMEETADFWRTWADRLELRYYGLSELVITLFKRSQFYLRSHVDNHGSIIASADSDMLQHGRDTYSYMWPRDAAYVATALDWIGDRHNARKFFEFMNEVVTKDGYLMHKYRPDRSLGSSWHGWMVNGHPELPIQEDETALVLWALWEHWESSKDLDFLSGMYESLIRPAANFLVDYRDPHTGLPKPSYNLWEEKFAVHTYTVASVYAGLLAASRFALLLGDEQSHNRFLTASREVKDALIKYLYLPDESLFVRSLYIDEGKTHTLDKTVDASSAYGVFVFGVLEPADERLKVAMQKTKDALTLKTPVGGIARYQGDNYYRTHSDIQGNPWIITTLWNAQYSIALAQTDQDLDDARKILHWTASTATASGVLAEQLDPYTREHVSASPLTWSHAEYIRTVILYLRKLDELSITRT